MNDKKSSSDRTPRGVTRRRALTGFATAAIASTAGCAGLLGDDSENGEGDGTNNGDGDDSGNGEGDGTNNGDDDDSGNGEGDGTPEYPYPFDYQPETLYIQPGDPWQVIVESETFTGANSDRHPSTLETGGYTQYENPRDSSDSPTLTHTVLVFENAETAEDYYNDTVGDIHDHEHGFVEETELNNGFYQQVDDAFAYVLDDEYEPSRFTGGYDERHSGTAIIRIGNLVTTVEHHRIAPGDPTADDYEYHGNTDRPTSYGEDVISHWASNNDDISNYLLNA